MKVENMEEDLVLLIDADSLIYYEAYKESVYEALEGIDNRIKTILEENNTNKYVMFLTGSDCFRYSMAQSNDYKESRKGLKKPLHFYTIKSYLKSNYNAITVPKLEADDCVVLYNNLLPYNTRICSPDKDVLRSAVGKHYNYQLIAEKDKNGNKLKNKFHSKGFITTSEEDSKDFLYLQMLQGDHTDSISGIKGVGEKTAEKWLNSWKNSEHFECGVKSIETFILEKYIEKYGSISGICKFHETFRLVYILQNKEDLVREKIDLPELLISEFKKEVEKDEFIEW
jgi:5'-3' exonuclease